MNKDYSYEFKLRPLDIIKDKDINSLSLNVNTKYSLLLELAEKALRSFFESRWLFFTNASQGKLVNTFLKEVLRSGDAFGQLGLMVAQFNQIIIFLKENTTAFVIKII